MRQGNDPLNTKSEVFDLNVGVGRDTREKLAGQLNECLATSYVLYSKIHQYHWNVAGPLFYSVHKLTDEHYQNMAEAIDDLAERIRAIGFPVEPGLGNWLKTSAVADTTSIPSARDMVAEMSQDHQKAAEQFRKVSEEAHEAGDLYTHDLTTGRIGFHEEAAWMLNAMLAD